MTFDQVLPALKEGKWIRFHRWIDGLAVRMARDQFAWSDDRPFTAHLMLGMDELRNEGWEIVVELPKTTPQPPRVCFYDDTEFTYFANSTMMQCPKCQRVYEVFDFDNAISQEKVPLDYRKP